MPGNAAFFAAANLGIIAAAGKIRRAMGTQFHLSGIDVYITGIQ